MSQPTPFPASPASDWPVRFQFKVSWSCLAAPFNRFEQITPQAPAVAYCAPSLAGQEVLPPLVGSAVGEAEPPAVPVRSATHWEMVVPKMTRPTAAKTPVGGTAELPAGGRLGMLALPRDREADAAQLPAPPTFAALTAESAAAGFVKRFLKTIGGVRAWRPSPQLRGYALGGAITLVTGWLWMTYSTPSGQWVRQRTSAAGSAPASSGRQLVLFRQAGPTASERLEFEWTPDSRAVGIVIRAPGGGLTADTYSAVLISVAPLLTSLSVERFAVAGGVEGPHSRKLIPLAGSASKIDVRLEGERTEFSLYVQGSLADSWSDGRIAGGSPGFFYDKDGLPIVGSVKVSFPGSGQSGYAGSLSKLLAELK